MATRALAKAASSGEIDTLDALLAAGEDVHATDEYLMQPIHRAAASGQCAAVAFLLDHGARIEAVDNLGFTPLHHACSQGGLDTMELLVSRGADVHKVTKDGRTTLYLSVQAGKLEAVEYLLGHSVAVDSPTEDGWSVLHAAAENGDHGVMALLVEHGADAHAKSKVGELPVHVAARKNDSVAIKYLLERSVPVDTTFAGGFSALHLAARIDDLHTMTLLVEHGADTHAKTKNGRSTLHVSSWMGNTDAIRYLIERGVALNAADNDGWNELHYAAHGGNVDAINLLVDHGVDLHKLTEFGQTTLFLAALKGNADAVHYLLERGVVQSADSDGWTPLLVAASAGDVRAMQYLVEYGGDVHCTDKTGGNILRQAIYRGRVGALPYIIDLGVDINAIDENYGDWLTPLILAIWYPSIETSSEMAFILCSRGAEWNEEHHQQAMRVSKLRDDNEGVSRAEGQNRQRWREGLCVCVQHWSHHQLTTPVPVEVITRGAVSVETYLADIKTSGAKGIMSRCKSCVVGPSEWGKTSLVRTLVARKPSLTQLKDRTIGIDLVPCVFHDGDSDSDDSSTAQLEVTFWDFAGQTVYHVAHRPFFSRRTLYIVAVDVDAYSKALLEARAKPQKVMETTMNRFMSKNVLRWVGMILTHHPDARFVFVGTKADRVNDKNQIQDVRDDVEDRLRAWERLRGVGHGDSFLLPKEAEKGTNRLSASFQWFTFNGQTSESAEGARQFVQRAISSLDFGFPMGKMYSQVLHHIKARREEARSAPNENGRIENSIVLCSRLLRELMREIDGLKYEVCEKILRTLHDLGDILWYEHDDAGVFKDYIILDPMLVVDVVREVIRHDFDAKTGIAWPQDGRLSHELLRTFGLWKDMDHDKEMTHAFKTLLQHFQLAYPADDDVMHPESDLIVPTYWKVKRNRPVGSRSLVTQKSVCDVFTKHRWCWEYELPSELSEIVFDQFAVQSHGAQSNRKIQDGRIEATDDEFATSISLIPQTASSDVIRVEVSGTTMERSWHLMRFYLMKMEKVLDGYKGFRVERYILHRTSPHSNEETRHPLDRIINAVKTAVGSGNSESSVRTTMPWMPPDMLWFVDQAWKMDIHKFQQMQMQPIIEAKLEVIRKLAIAGSEPRFPALWSLQWLHEENKVVVRVLSDLSGVCYHSPMEIATGPPWLAQYGSYFKAGLSVVSTVATEALSMPLVDKAVDAIKTSLSARVDRAVRIHSLTERLNTNVSESTPASTARASLSDIATPFESRTAKLPPEVARAVLHGLLKIYNDSSDELNISELTNLECVVTEGGEYVWAHEHEISMLGDKVTRCAAPPSVWADLPEPSPASSLTHSPASSPTNKGDASFKLSLCVESVAGLNDWDWYKTYCTWQLYYGETSSKPIASGATTQNADKSAPPSWGSLKTMISSVDSVEMLSKCRLDIQVKRRSRIGWTKLIGEAQLWLEDKLTLSPNQSWQSDTIQVELEPTRFVTIQLACET